MLLGKNPVTKVFGSSVNVAQRDGKLVVIYLREGTANLFT